MHAGVGIARGTSPRAGPAAPRGSRPADGRRRRARPGPGSGRGGRTGRARARGGRRWSPGGSASGPASPAVRRGGRGPRRRGAATRRARRRRTAAGRVRPVEGDQGGRRPGAPAEVGRVGVECGAEPAGDLGSTRPRAPRGWPGVPRARTPGAGRPARPPATARMGKQRDRDARSAPRDRPGRRRAGRGAPPRPGRDGRPAPGPSGAGRPRDRGQVADEGGGELAVAAVGMHPGRSPRSARRRAANPAAAARQGWRRTHRDQPRPGAGQDDAGRLVVEVPAQDVGQLAGRPEPPGRVLLQALQADRLQLAADRPVPLAGPVGLVVEDPAQDDGRRVADERRRAGQQRRRGSPPARRRRRRCRPAGRPGPARAPCTRRSPSAGRPGWWRRSPPATCTGPGRSGTAGPPRPP